MKRSHFLLVAAMLFLLGLALATMAFVLDLKKEHKVPPTKPREKADVGQDDR
jgi:hypothetical protein